MGIIYTEIRLGNVGRSDLEEINATALVDSGALHLCIPEHVAVQLQLVRLQKREVTTADGRSHLVDYVGPVKIALLGRECITGALVLGNQVLLGAIAMEDMDLVIEPSRQKVSVNPASPNIASSIAKKTSFQTRGLVSLNSPSYTRQIAGQSGTDASRYTA
jgi:clan AA aspartic protease